MELEKRVAKLERRRGSRFFVVSSFCVLLLALIAVGTRRQESLTWIQTRGIRLMDDAGNISLQLSTDGLTFYVRDNEGGIGVEGGLGIDFVDEDGDRLASLHHDSGIEFYGPRGELMTRLHQFGLINVALGGEATAVVTSRGLVLSEIETRQGGVKTERRRLALGVPPGVDLSPNMDIDAALTVLDEGGRPRSVIGYGATSDCHIRFYAPEGAQLIDIDHSGVTVLEK